MADYRATQHNGRVGKKGAYSPCHNDRNYDYKNDPHIYADKTPNNIYYNCYDGFYQHKDIEKDGKMTFKEAETKYYDKHFKRQWVDTNYKYDLQYHPEKKKDWETWKKQKQNLPEEVYLQVGKMEKHPTSQQFLEVFKLYQKELQQWSKDHGDCFKILNMSFQVDEAVPQLHIRRVWQYRNSNGTLCIGQEKALEQAGIQLPDPSKKKDRFNNRKMVFDKIAREIYLQCCFKCGLDVETIPLPNVRHNMDKDEFLSQKVADLFADKEAEIKALEEDTVKANQEAHKRLKTANMGSEAVMSAFIRQKGLQGEFESFCDSYFGLETENSQQQQYSF